MIGHISPKYFKLIYPTYPVDDTEEDERVEGHRICPMWAKRLITCRKYSNKYACRISNKVVGNIIIKIMFN